jgi:hypothetical protein
VSEITERELERRAMTGDRDSLRGLIASLARRGMFFQCDECGAFVPPQARDRHTYEHEYHRAIEKEADRIQELNRKHWERYDGRCEEESKRQKRSGGMPFVPLPPAAPRPPATGIVAARPKNEPLYHRLRISTQSTLRFFRDPAQGQTNSHGQGCLPAGSHFYAYGLSLIPDEGSDPGSVRAIRNSGQVWFLLGGAVSSRDARPSYINNDLPAQAVVSKRCFRAQDVMPDEAFSDLVPMHRLSVHGKPVEILALECFAVDLILPHMPESSIGITCILHGLRLTGITG